MAITQDHRVAGLIASAYHALRDALAPYVEEQLRDKDGPDWIRLHNQRLEAANAATLSRTDDGLVAWDGYNVLKSIDVDSNFIFKSAFQKQKKDWKYICSVVVQLLRLRNIMISHPTGLIDEAQAFIFLIQCRELFQAVKEVEYSKRLDLLLDEFKKIQETRSQGSEASLVPVMIEEMRSLKGLLQHSDIPDSSIAALNAEMHSLRQEIAALRGSKDPNKIKVEVMKGAEIPFRTYDDLRHYVTLYITMVPGQTFGAIRRQVTKHIGRMGLMDALTGADSEIVQIDFRSWEDKYWEKLAEIEKWPGVKNILVIP